MMMMTMNKRSSLLFVFCLFALNAFPQEKDFGIWYNASAAYEVFNNLDIGLSTSFRTFDNAGKLEEAFLEGEISYKFNNYLAAAASYRISENIEDDDSYHIRHKWFADVKGTLPLGNLRLSGRAMFQQRYKTYIEDENDKLPTSHGRFRLKALYNFSTSPADPYIYAEIFCPLFKDSDRVIDKKRIGAGVELDITAHHSFDVEYIFQRDYFPDLSDDNILSFGYSLRF
ncbi:MAG: hypothetical protein A2V64_11665 [Bacteroidetes bacterium RBG_13_43_22]|nr:MAG: hypothetical protein A2V64_11665 [Bacteroidetes bacterium RBG_13_43_22]